MVLNSTFTKTIDIDLPPLLLWSSLSELSEMLPPGLQSLFLPPIKLNSQLSSCTSFLLCVCVCGMCVYIYIYIGEGYGNPLQYSCLENPMDRGDWQDTVHGVRRVGHTHIYTFWGGCTGSSMLRAGFLQLR